MRYAYEIQPDGTKTVHVFADEGARAQWVAACGSARGLLSGNSKEVKGAHYAGTAIVESLREQGVV